MGLIALTLSLVYHLQLDLAGVVGVELITRLLDDEIQGSIEIGSLQNATYEKIVARQVVFRDPEGREVIRAERVAAWPNWGALLSGVIYVDRVRLRGGLVTLVPSGTDESPTVSIAETFLPTRPSDGPPDPSPIRVVIDGIVIDEVTVRGAVPGFEGLRVENLRAEGRVEVSGDAHVFVHHGRADVTGPYRGRAQLDEISGSVDSDLRRDGIRFWARGHRGDDRFRALFRLWQEEALPDVIETHLDLQVALDPVRMSTLAEMEVAPGLENLRGTFRGHGRLAGEVSNLRLTGDVSSEAGRVLVTGHLPSDGPLRFDVRTVGPLRLEELVPAAPALRVGGRGHVLVALSDDGEPPEITLHAQAEPFRLDEYEIPALVADARVLDEALDLTEVRAEVAGGEVTASGTVGFDGQLDVRVLARLPQLAREPNVAALAPALRGAIDADLTIRTSAALAAPRIDGRAALRDVRYGASLAASTLNVRGHLSGDPPAPLVRATGDATGLRVGDLSFGTAHVGIRGGPGGYVLEARAADPRSGVRVDVEGRATSTDERLTLDSTRLFVDLGDGAAWTGRAGLTLRHGHSVEVRGLALERGTGRGAETLSASGTYRFRGPDDFDVRAQNLDLAQLERLAPEALFGIAGRGDLHLVVSGDLDTRPQGTLSLDVRGGRLRGVDGVELRAELALVGQTVRTQVRADLGERGRLAARGEVALTPAALSDPSRLAREVDLSALVVEADDLALRPILTLAGSDAPIAGRITTTVALGGSAERPSIRDAVLVLDHVAPEGWDPIRLKARLHYGDDRVEATHFWIANEGGELVSGSVALPLSLTEPPTDLASFWRSLRASPWTADVRLPPRRLDEWPRPLADSMPPGVLVTGNVVAHGEADGPHAVYRLVARVVEMPADGGQCSARLEPRLSVHGQLDGAIAVGTVRGYVGSATPVVEGSLTVNLPLDDWIEGGEVRNFPGTELRLRLLGVEMGSIPYACTYGAGPIYGTFTAKDVLTDQPVLGAVVEMPRLRVWERAGERGAARLTRPFRVHARAGSTPERDALSACVILGLAEGEATPGGRCREAEAAGPGELISRLRVPVRWTAGTFMPSFVEDGRVASWSDFNEVQVAPVVGFVPGIVAGDARITGRIAAAGPWERMQMRGALDVSRGHVQIDGLGQHLHGISGRIELAGDHAIFPSDRPLRASDSGGTVLVSGRAGFEGLIPRTVDLDVRAHNFPIRREGMVLASLSGGATVRGTISDDVTETTIRFGRRGDGTGDDGGRDLAIRLPEQTARALQPLEPHPSVLVVGTERAGGGGPSDAYVVRVGVDASEPFWVRRNDFAVQVSARLSATYQDPELRLAGSAQIRRGTFEIFGKRFELTEGSIQFGHAGREGAEQESATLDPQVHVIATYNVPGRSGETITVTVTGSLTSPRVAFSSTVTADQAEIISLLVAGGRRQGGTATQAAEEQAASFLAGVMAGILTLGLRQELGDVIPVLAIESQGFGGTRIRAGFSANELIPDFLREVIVGAYVEGFVTAAAEGTNAAGSSSGSGGVGGGVTLEFTFPNDLLLRGTYVPVDHGSLDLFYEP
ncbi:MAG: translocation/assembly module TamB domain-containing protein [Sandaracinaceae bacterium]|nr:translocation/assembly module TamB domain-containing protein [Sandaracinaceae bacterium]